MWNNLNRRTVKQKQSSGGGGGYDAVIRSCFVLMFGDYIM